MPRGHSGAVTAQAFSPDNQLLATGCEDGTIRVWNPETTALRWSVVGHDAAVVSLTWSSDAKQLASGARDGTSRVWDAVTGRQRLFGQAAPKGSDVQVAWSPDGRLVAMSGGDANVRICDASTQEERFVLQGHTQPVQRLAWSPDSKLLASSSIDGTLRLWDATTGKLFDSHATRPGEVNGVAFSPDGKQVAAAWIDENHEDPIRIWDVVSGKPVRTLEAALSGPQFVAWSADGKTLVAGGGDARLRAWSTETGKLLYEKPQGDRPIPIMGLAMARAGGQELVAVARQDGTVPLCEPLSGQVIRELPKARGDIRIAPNGSYTGGPGVDDEVVYVVQTADGQEALPAEFKAKYQGKAEGGKGKAEGGGAEGGRRIGEGGGRKPEGSACDSLLALWERGRGVRAPQAEPAPPRRLRRPNRRLSRFPRRTCPRRSRRPAQPPKARHPLRWPLRRKRQPATHPEAPRQLSWIPRRSSRGSHSARWHWLPLPRKSTVCDPGRSIRAGTATDPPTCATAKTENCSLPPARMEAFGFGKRRPGGCCGSCTDITTTSYER